MDRLRAFVSDDALEIERVTNRHVLCADARSTQHVAAVARDVQCHAAVVPLGERYLRRLHLALVLEPAELVAQQLCGGDLARHFRKSELDRLCRGQRLAEHLAGPGVVDELRQAGLRGADYTPGNAVTRLGEAGKWPLESLHGRQQV